MAESNATILIPDISGFTEFITTTELEHGAHAINILLDSILEAVGDEYEVAEIEGDAVLFFKKGDAPVKKEIMATCLKIFNAFHFKRKWMQQHVICPCGACQAVIDLTLKFVVHHGPLAEIKVGRFIKPSGPDMIVAHRLLKNSIGSNEYVLMTEKIWQQDPGSPEIPEMKWETSSDEFASIGKIDYRFALLESVRKEAPLPPPPENYNLTDNSSHLEMAIAANFRDVYMILMNIPGRTAWVPGLQKVEQDFPDVFIGSIHRCQFENYKAIISPVYLKLSDEGILFTEKRELTDMDMSLIYEYVFRKVDENNSVFASRLMPATGDALPSEIGSILFNDLKSLAEKLKAYCEKMKESFFEPGIPRN